MSEDNTLPELDFATLSCKIQNFRITPPIMTFTLFCFYAKLCKTYSSYEMQVITPFSMAFDVPQVVYQTRRWFIQQSLLKLEMGVILACSFSGYVLLFT